MAGFRTDNRLKANGQFLTLYRQSQALGNCQTLSGLFLQAVTEKLPAVAAMLLDGIHGGIRIPQHVVSRMCAARANRNPNTRCHEQIMTIELDRLAHDVVQPACQNSHPGGLFDLFA